MVQLPTFDVSDAQATRLMKTFGTPAAYKQWLRDKITEAVQQSEGKAREQALREFIAQQPVEGDPLEGAS